VWDLLCRFPNEVVPLVCYQPKHLHKQVTRWGRRETDVREVQPKNRSNAFLTVPASCHDLARKCNIRPANPPSPSPDTLISATPTECDCFEWIEVFVRRHRRDAIIPPFTNIFSVLHHNHSTMRYTIVPASCPMKHHRAVMLGDPVAIVHIADTPPSTHHLGPR